MEKALIQLIVSIALFAAIWYGIKSIDLMSILEVEQVKSSSEEKIGDLLWEMIELEETVIKPELTTLAIDSLLVHICEANNIDPSTIKWQVIYKNEVNAFAMPNHQLIIYSGLITECKTESELVGVLAHEIAHMELHHVMKKLAQEIGFSVLLSSATGSAGSEVMIETLKMLSSSAYDRSIEKEADLKAVDYLIEAGLDPNQFADFLYRLSSEESEISEYLSWVSTHPYSQERAEYIIEHASERNTKQNQVLSQSTWQKLQTEMESQSIF